MQLDSPQKSSQNKSNNSPKCSQMFYKNACHFCFKNLLHVRLISTERGCQELSKNSCIHNFWINQTQVISMLVFLTSLSKCFLQFKIQHILEIYKLHVVLNSSSYHCEFLFWQKCILTILFRIKAKHQNSALQKMINTTCRKKKTLAGWIRSGDGPR